MSHLDDANRAMWELISRITEDGFRRISGYVLPPILDERIAGSTLLQRAFGLVDLPNTTSFRESDTMRFRTVPMLYSSQAGAAVFKSYTETMSNDESRASYALAVGSTGSSQSQTGERPMTWPELSRDLLYAARHSDQVYVYSLEGSARRDFITKMLELDWSREPAVVDKLAVKAVDVTRACLRSILKESCLRNPTSCPQQAQTDKPGQTSDDDLPHLQTLLFYTCVTPQVQNI